MRYCSKCGHQLNGSESVCPNCQEPTGFEVPPQVTGYPRPPRPQNHPARGCAITLFVLVGVPCALVGACSVIAVATDRGSGSAAPVLGIAAVIGIIAIFIAIALFINLLDKLKKK